MSQGKLRGCHREAALRTNAAERASRSLRRLTLFLRSPLSGSTQVIPSMINSVWTLYLIVLRRSTTLLSTPDLRSFPFQVIISSRVDALPAKAGLFELAHGVAGILSNSLDVNVGQLCGSSDRPIALHRFMRGRSRLIGYQRREGGTWKRRPFAEAAVIDNQCGCNNGERQQRPTRRPNYRRQKSAGRL